MQQGDRHDDAAMAKRHMSLIRMERGLPAGAEGQELFGAELAVRLYEFFPLGICLSDKAGRLFNWPGT